jgi:hypothetical protein
MKGGGSRQFVSQRVKYLQFVETNYSKENMDWSVHHKSRNLPRT